VVESANKPPDSEGRNRVLRYLPPALVLTLLAVFFATGLHRYLTLETLVEYRPHVHGFVGSRPLTTVILFILVYALLVTLSIPAAGFMSIAAGLLFGWASGGALAVLGASLGAASIFLIARSSVGEPILRMAGPRVQKLAASFRADSFSYLLFLRLLPIMPFWVTNLAAAFFGMRFQIFMAATLTGAIPVCYAFAVAGSGLDAAIAAHEQQLADCVAAGRQDCQMHFEPDSLLTPRVIVALGLLGVLALGPIILRKWQARRRETQA